ncbi:MAG TPA: flagellar biosynthesis repressor FlbT [Hyphomicrobiaceae bacterium]|nr:flagellar biosynthesis repressor FlbT [Hyphomicrobiaceae bacterium]
MTRGLQVPLRAGDRIYVNGAVLRVDRKVSIEFMNDAVFLLEGHVLHPEQATTPLRQLYFVLQTMLLEPRNAAATRGMFEESYQSLLETFSNNEVLQALRSVHTLVVKGSVFEALKGIRGLFPIEDSILSESHGHELEIREAASCR